MEEPDCDNCHCYLQELRTLRIARITAQMHRMMTTCLKGQPRQDADVSRVRDDATWRIPAVLAGENCTGSEPDLLDCPGIALRDGLSGAQCDITQEVNVVCFNNASSGVYFARSGALNGQIACINKSKQQAWS